MWATSTASEMPLRTQRVQQCLALLFMKQEHELRVSEEGENMARETVYKVVRVALLVDWSLRRFSRKGCCGGSHDSGHALF